jgi:hypothetical protein
LPQCSSPIREHIENIAVLLRDSWGKWGELRVTCGDGDTKLCSPF